MKTDITVVLDRSGSMGSIAKDVIKGLNAFVKAQQEVEGEARFTLVQFDDQYEVVHFRVPMADVPTVTARTYQPRGSTALLDAIGRTINDISSRVGQMAAADRPDQIVFAVQTDGFENASVEYTREQVFGMIRDRERKGTPQSKAVDEPTWEFVFLAANQDAIMEGDRIGFSASRAMDFDADGGGVAAMYAVMSSKVSMKRRVAGASMDFTEAERARTRKRP
jgi:hypothetical protein